MKVAISTEGEFVSAHFGRCPEFTIVDVKDSKVEKMETIQNPGHEPGFIPKFLHEKGVKYIICGGMGARATGFFEELGIHAIVGVSGKINDVIKEFSKNTLEGGESLCSPGAGKGYGIEKSECDHPNEKDCED
ncbi:MAG: NifB/NifX family molybdenum-iron cluster-binding protein [Candidatus Omnitrophica bacterium]|nr:NifB/NifX family molybdenum-iron cluster-binding protein [Candidatus Omnitrophota bacterium]